MPPEQRARRRLLEHRHVADETVRFARDRRFTVRVDAFNPLNQDNYGAPVSSMSSTSFGLNTNNFGRRIIQLGGKFTF